MQHSSNPKRQRGQVRGLFSPLCSVSTSSRTCFSTFARPSTRCTALQEGYLRDSLQATYDDFPSRTPLGRLKVNLAKLFSPLL
jgi:hypothetical protein